MLNILILDDEEIICKTLDLMIKRVENIGEVKTFLACDGFSALEIMKKDDIDIILSDLCMDEMDGFTFIERVLDRKIPPLIIAVSAYGDFEYVRNAFKLGIFDYIVKPVDFNVFQETLRNAVQKINTKKMTPYDVIEDIKEYVARNIEKDISLTQASNYLSMDYSYFSKYFKQMTGQSFSRYVMSEKMKYCEKLMRESNIKIHELAYKMGYNNASNFSRAFYKYTGKWPTEYKNTKKEESVVSGNEED